MFSYLAKSHFSFFIFNFLGGNLSLKQVCIFKFIKKFSFFNTQYDLQYFKRKKFQLSEGPFFKLSAQKLKRLFWNSLVYLLPIQNYSKHSNFQNFCQNLWTLLYMYVHEPPTTQ
jgi:hypothetical protein